MERTLVKTALVFGFPSMGHVLPLQANYVKLKIVFHGFFFHGHDLKVILNNFVVRRFLIQMILLLDLQ